MGIRNFFHKIKMGFVRAFEESIPNVSSKKRYGDSGENEFIYSLMQLLPDCQIKRNVIIDNSEGAAEIDCIVLYKDKLFAIEIKRWKGCVYETENGFVQEKTDQWTGETHKKFIKSPFGQLNRSIYLLKKSIPEKAWINSVVFFDNDEFEEISSFSKDIWFSDISQLVNYIVNEGKETKHHNAVNFFDKCRQSDLLYSNVWDRSLHCLICDESLKFLVENTPLSRSQIEHIEIEHHWSYDEIFITSLNGRVYSCIHENSKIGVIENRRVKEYALCKLDYIEIG